MLSFYLSQNRNKLNQWFFCIYGSVHRKLLNKDLEIIRLTCSLIMSLHGKIVNIWMHFRFLNTATIKIALPPNFMTSSYIKMLSDLADIVENLLPVGLRNQFFSIFMLNWLKIYLTTLQSSFCYIISLCFCKFCYFHTRKWPISSWNVWWRHLIMQMMLHVHHYSYQRIDYLKNDLKIFYSCSNFCYFPKKPKNKK